jgi:aryl-alcohol dehydrogenase-like predicted oxidoreductase
MRFESRPLGRTGLKTGAIGLSASYGAPADSVEYAFDQGVNYMYWGSMRREAFGEGLRRLAPKRDRYALVIQSYSPIAPMISISLERALKRLNTDYADVLLLGLWNRPVPRRVMDVCRKMKERGRIRYVAISTHKRTLVPLLAADPDYDLFHVRYNAKHTGAEREIFPLLPASNRPGIVSFTATSWGQLLDAKKIPKGERTPTATDCYRFVLSNPAVDLCLTGPSNMDHVRDAVRALELGPMTDEEMSWMRRVGSRLYGRIQKAD